MNTSLTHQLATALRELAASIRFTPLGIGPLKHLASADRALAAFDAPQLPTFTVFVRDADNTGTTYVTAVEAADAEAAKVQACQLCREDWSYADDAPLHVLGVASGDVTILEWDDQE